MWIHAYSLKAVVCSDSMVFPQPHPGSTLHLDACLLALPWAVTKIQTVLVFDDLDVLRTGQVFAGWGLSDVFLKV